MSFLIFLLLAGVIGSLFIKGVDAKTASLVRLVLCIGLVVLSIGRCKSTQVSTGTDLTMDRRWLVGWKMGGVLAADIPEGGSVVVVQMNEVSEAIKKYNASELEGFLKGAGDVKFELSVARSEGADSNGNPMSVSIETIKEMVKLGSNSVAVVSFVNIPLSRLTRIELPPTYVFDPMGSKYWREALASGQIQAAIYPELPDGKAPPDRVTGNPETRFNEMYKLATKP